MDIEALAKKAGFTVANGSYGLKFSGGDFERLVRLAKEEEREACAVIAETPVAGEQDDITMEAKDRVAAAIRKRSNALAQPRAEAEGWSESAAAQG